MGFMFSPERLNVLLSSARDALIVLGNAETFHRSHKGHKLWGHLFHLLIKGGHMFDGLPVPCEPYKDRTANLTTSNDFDEQCPDDECKKPW